MRVHASKGSTLTSPKRCVSSPVTEPIPNDPVVFAEEIPRQMQFAISLALVKFMSSEEGQEAMNPIYAIQGFVRCSDADYDGLREALSYNQ